MQKRHARWIATLAIAGTTALAGAAAAAAATGDTTPRQAKDVSPATCTALAADLASTLTNAAKGLLATPPDLTGATKLVTQANKLQDALTSLDCGSVSVVAPSVPALPSVPAVPSAPAIPSVPALPPVSSLPSVPALPSAPSLPVVGSLPTAPSVPSLPGGVGTAVPGLPALPGTSGLPSL